MFTDDISDERIDAKKAKDRRLVAIAAMKGLAEMPANDIINAIDGNANVEGAVSKAHREIDIHHLYIQNYIHDPSMIRSFLFFLNFQMQHKLLDLFLDRSVDSNVRGMVVEVLVSKSLSFTSGRIQEETSRKIVKSLGDDITPAGREFSGFMISRLYELASEDMHLNDILRYI